MKKNLHITLFTIISALLLSSCSVYEEITFHKGGKMSYNMTFDAGELLKMFPEKGISGGKMSDSIISFAEMIEKEKTEMIGQYPDMEKDLDNIKPLYMRFVENAEKCECYISIYGDFKDSEALANAFQSMNNLASQAKDTDNKIPASKENMTEWMSNFPQYHWNGKTMKRYIDAAQIIPDEDDMEEDPTVGKDPFSDWTSFFEGSKMTVKYHFPQKVESVSDPNALLSQDGKTVIIEYPGSVFTKSPDKANIEIKLK